MAPDPQTTTEGKTPTTSATQQLKTQLLHALEISLYELAVLEKHLVSHSWIPNTTQRDRD